jgi:hypothetical protein
MLAAKLVETANQENQDVHDTPTFYGRSQWMHVAKYFHFAIICEYYYVSHIDRVYVQRKQS